MFDFAPVGLGVAVVGLAFVSLVGWRLIPRREEAASAGQGLSVADNSVYRNRAVGIRSSFERAVATVPALRIHRQTAGRMSEGRPLRAGVGRRRRNSSGVIRSPESTPPQPPSSSARAHHHRPTRPPAPASKAAFPQALFVPARRTLQPARPTRPTARACDAPPPGSRREIVGTAQRQARLLTEAVLAALVASTPPTARSSRPAGRCETCCPGAPAPRPGPRQRMLLRGCRNSALGQVRGVREHAADALTGRGTEPHQRPGTAP